MGLYETGRQLLESGIISGHDSTVEAALTKLMFLLGQGLKLTHIAQVIMKLSKIRHARNHSLAGEITL